MYVDPYTGAKFEMKINVKNKHIVFSVKKISVSILNRLMNTLSILMHVYTTKSENIKKEYKLLGYICESDLKQTSESSVSSCQKDKMPSQKMITLAEKNKLEKDHDSYIDNKGNIKNPKYYVIIQGNTYRKIISEKKKFPYVGAQDKRRSNVSDFCCYQTQQMFKPKSNEMVSMRKITFEEFEKWITDNRDNFFRDYNKNFMTDKVYIDVQNADMTNQTYNMFECDKNNNKEIAFSSKERIRENIYDFKCVDKVSTKKSKAQSSNKKSMCSEITKLLKVSGMHRPKVATTDTEIPDENTFGWCIEHIFGEKIFREHCKLLEDDNENMFYNILCRQEVLKTSKDNFRKNIREKLVSEVYKRYFEFMNKTNIVIFDLNSGHIKLPDGLSEYYINVVYERSIILLYDSKHKRFHRLQNADTKTCLFLSNSIQPVLEYYKKNIRFLSLSKKVDNVTSKNGILQGINDLGLTNYLYIPTKNKLEYVKVETSLMQTLQLQSINSDENKKTKHRIASKVDMKQYAYVLDILETMFDTKHRKLTDMDNKYQFSLNNNIFKIMKSQTANYESKLKKFIYTEKLSHTLKEHMLWLYSIKKQEGKSIDDYLSDCFILRSVLEKKLSDELTKHRQIKVITSSDIESAKLEIMKHLKKTRNIELQNQIRMIQLQSFYPTIEKNINIGFN